MQEINFYREARDYYDVLIPEKLEGLILFLLYDKYGTEEFKEKQIIDVINMVYNDLGRGSSRNERERDNAIILKFQEFFLWRDGVKRRYKFKAYGREFCEGIRDRLQKRYNPSEIKRLFDSLHDELLRHIEKEDLNFNLWYSEHFTRRNGEISFQVEILDQQVSESVRDFKKKFKEGNHNVFQLLDEIEINLDEIKEHAAQLKDSFRATFEIEYKLDDLIANTNQDNSIFYINEVMEFNSSIRGHLEQVSTRIDKIKPRIREFIYEFNQRDFDRKTGLLLNFLLKSSRWGKMESGKKILMLPKGIPAFLSFNNKHLLRFTIIPSKNISPKAPVDVVKLGINLERQLKLVKIAEQNLIKKEAVKYWYNQALKIINEERELNYGPFFFKILGDSALKLSIAILVTSNLIRKLSTDKNYRITVSHEMDKSHLHPKIMIWKMNIRKI